MFFFIFLLLVLQIHAECQDWLRDYKYSCHQRRWEPNIQPPELLFESWDHKGRVGDERNKQREFKKVQHAYIKGFREFKNTCPDLYKEWMTDCEFFYEYRKTYHMWGRDTETGEVTNTRQT